MGVRLCRVMLGVATVLAMSASTIPAEAQTATPTGNVIFFHPDGIGLNGWGIARAFKAGPDGELNYDRLPGLGVYTGHMSNSLTATSNGGATVHAYGIKVGFDAFGMDEGKMLTAASGKDLSLAQEAHAAGKAVALVQTGQIAEPGTAVFAASAESRKDVQNIAAQVMGSGFPVLMHGGEKYLLSKGTMGRFGEGERDDGRNLIDEAMTAGYTIVFDRDELLAIDTNSVDKLIGVFAHDATFSAQPPVRNLIDRKPSFVKGAPTVAEMTKVALEIISRDDDGYFAVIEEEASDNFPNRMNAVGAVQAIVRADDAIGVILDHLEKHTNTMMVLSSDSDAGGMQISAYKDLIKPDEALPPHTFHGGILMGIQGQYGDPFISAPDNEGNRFAFGVAFTGAGDVPGGILVRTAGLNHERVKPLMDNTDVYKIMHDTLFGGDLLSR